jgi:cystathionine beta-lyase
MTAGSQAAAALSCLFCSDDTLFETDRIDMEELKFVDRRGTNCAKWDDLGEMFGSDELIGAWVADMDFECPQCVKKALSEYVERNVYGYYSVSDSYYEAFIDWEKKHHGYKVEKDWIRFAPGVVPAIYWVIDALTERGDGVIIMPPVYYPFRRAVNDTGRVLVNVPLANYEERYTMDFGAITAAAKNPKNKLLILCSPHNPVGRVWTRRELEELLSICKKNDVIVISDEIHGDLITGGQKHTAAATVRGFSDMIVTLTSSTKTFNLADIQNSFVIIENDGLREKYDAFVKTISMSKGSNFGYIAAEAAYRGGRPWLESLLKQVKENYEYLKGVIESELPEAKVAPLEGTYLMWVNMAPYLTEGDSRKTGLGVAVDHGAWFGKGYEGYIRINLATSPEMVEEIGRRIVKALTK